jgi:hypothetical protein
MIVAIHQPQYLPWMGYFGKILLSDAFVILDTVQYVKNEWQNRNRLRTPQGWQWITVPVEYHYPQTILETRINQRQPWARKHVNTLRQLYSKAPYFKSLFPAYKAVYQRHWESLAELNVELLYVLLEQLGIQRTLYRSSQMNIQSEDPTGRLIEICAGFDASTYLSGENGRHYLDRYRFEEAGLSLGFQAFDHPTYTQLHPGFESHLSIVDALFCQGPQETMRLIQSGNQLLDS